MFVMGKVKGPKMPFTDSTKIPLSLTVPIIHRILTRREEQLFVLTT